MQLTINGELRDFIPMQAFRTHYSLPHEFSVSLFAPKNYTGLGSIDKAGDALQALQQTILDSIPESPPGSWMGLSLSLQQLFHRQLSSINPIIGLKSSEIEYAVVGFGEVCQLFTHSLVTMHLTRQSFPVFETIYMDWLNRTTEVSQQLFRYAHDHQVWSIRVVMHAYGRVGLIVRTGDAIWHVYDARLACPAEGFMFALLRGVTSKLTALAQQVPLKVSDEA